MQKSINTQRLERNEALGRGVGAGLGCLLAVHSKKIITETLMQSPFFKEVAVWLINTPPPSWTTFLVAALPNAVATLAYNAAEYHLESTYSKKSLDDYSEFCSVVTYGTSALFFAASVVLVAKISGIAMVTILGYSVMGWVANQVIKIACALFLSFGSQKEVSKKLDQLMINQIDIKSLPKGKKELPVKEFPPVDQLPIDIELWDMISGFPAALAGSTAYGLDFVLSSVFGGPGEKLKIGETQETECPCERYKKKEPQNLDALSKYPNTEAATTKEVKGIPNLGTTCYQNSAMQVLFNLIDTTGEEHFTVYRILNDPLPYQKDHLQKRLEQLNLEKMQMENSVPNEEMKLEKEYLEGMRPLDQKIVRLEFSLWLLENASKEEKVPLALKDNEVLISYLKRALAKPRLKGKEPIDKEKVKILVNGYLKAIEYFLQMKKEYKEEKGIQKGISASFRQAIYDLYFLTAEKDGLTAQRDVEALLNPLLEILGVSCMPFQDTYSYKINQENLDIAEKLIKEKVSKKNPENKEPLTEDKKPTIPLEKDQKYKYVENVNNHPLDTVSNKNEHGMLLVKIDDNIASSSEPIKLSSLVIKSQDEELENFKRGDQVISEIKKINEERNLPLKFPDWNDCNNKDKPFFEFKGKQIQVVQATRTTRLLEGDTIPPFTIINLTRAVACGKHTQKHHTQVMPDKILELEVFDQEKKTTRKIIQELSGACIHFGGTGAGHWISYVRKGEDWYLCNDSSVSKVTDIAQMYNQMSVNGTVFTYLTKKEEIKN